MIDSNTFGIKQKGREIGGFLISIICPTYNSIGKINRLIESINSQLYAEYEVIFVDDGSTDGTYDYLKKYFGDKDNVILLRQKNSGPGIARKRGFRECRGDLIYFIDSDDWLPGKDTLSKINEVFLENKDVDVCIARRKSYSSNEVFSPFIVGDLDFGVYNLDIFYNHLIYGNMSMKVFRRRVLSLNGFVGSFNFEDLTTSYIALDKCRYIKYVNDYFYVSNDAEDKQSLTMQDDYEARTLPERARNLVVTMSIVKSPQIRIAVAATMFETYCSFILHGMLKDNKNLANQLRVNILRYDLSGFYKTYGLKKRVLLFLMKLWGK